MFRHFIITRFNLRVDSWEFTKSGKEVLTNDWLEERFYLFENFCLPSVKNQQNQNFIWCIFFDENTPVLYQKRIQKISNEYSNIRIFYIVGFAELNTVLSKFIKNNADNDNEFVITTRLDNDDILHKHFISTVQQLFLPADKLVININKGFQICIEHKYSEVRNYSNRFNPFISIVEQISNFQSVFSRQHFEWINAGNKMEYKDRRLWGEIVHQSNKLNSVNKACKKNIYFNNGDFGLTTEKIILEPFLKILFFNFKLGSKFLVKRFLTWVK